MSEMEQKYKDKMYRRLPELKELEEVIERLRPFGKIETLAKIPYKDMEFPIHCITLGSEEPTAPTLLLVGGVHGLERIGTQVLNSVLLSTARSLTWDDYFKDQLKHHRIIYIPLLNPVGMYRMSRSNGNDVDLMRNAPVESDVPNQSMYGGHRYSRKLPFYRGELGKMELENQVLVKVIREKLFTANVSIALDCHSGFGVRDRLWFPYARTTKPFPHLAEMHALKDLFDETYQHHVYTVEPQGRQYTTHGDVWDYCFDEFQKIKKPGQLFLPLTLEMGSWLWIRKNPFQVFNPLGIFNPIAPHRAKRMLRRHKNLVDFLRRAVMSSSKWVELTENEREQHKNEAMEFWYPGIKS
jgi:hypothetical protein